MSFLNSVSNWYNAPWGSKANPEKPSEPTAESRYKEVKTPAVEEPKGFGDRKSVVLFLTPRRDRVLIAPEMGVMPLPNTYALTPLHYAELREKGFCVEISHFAPTSDYWQQPPEQVLCRRMDEVLECRCRRESLKVTAGLRSSASQCGTWFLVDLLSKEEMQLRLPSAVAPELAKL